MNTYKEAHEAADKAYCASVLHSWGGGGWQKYR
jgi:hypothetical protein